jgi:hypothetical protein
MKTWAISKLHYEKAVAEALIAQLETTGKTEIVKVEKRRLARINAEIASRK